MGALNAPGEALAFGHVRPAVESSLLSKLCVLAGEKMDMKIEWTIWALQSALSFCLFQRGCGQGLARSVLQETHGGLWNAHLKGSHTLHALYILAFRKGRI